MWHCLSIFDSMWATIISFSEKMIEEGKLGLVFGNCQIVAFYNILPIQYARFVTSLWYVGLIVHFNSQYIFFQ